MKFVGKGPLLGGFSSLLLLFCVISVGAGPHDPAEGVGLAPDFEAIDSDGVSFKLSDFEGENVVVHVTNIENPLCIECEPSLKSQVEELQRLRELRPDQKIVTLNMRKNPYSRDGKFLAETWWEVEIDWHWVEDFEPYPIASKYVEFWSRGSGFANPTIILIDQNGRVVEYHHVYQMGEGVIEGIQDAETLSERIEDLESGAQISRDLTLDGSVPIQEVTFMGMFGLGIVTSLAPCSLALLIAVFSYLMTTHRRKILEAEEGKSTSPKEGFMIGVAFTLGMAMVFFFIGVFISNLGLFVRDSRFFDLAAGVLMIILGITTFKPLGEILDPITSRFPSYSREGDMGNVRNNKSLLEKLINISVTLFKYSAFIGAFSLGVFFALGWAPCAISLVFPVLIWLMAQNIPPLMGGMMLFVFGVGHGVPIIPIATFSRTFCGAIGERYLSAGKWISGSFAVLIIATGLVFAARYFGYTFW